MPTKPAATPTSVPIRAPAHENLATALAAFQADMPTVFKGQTARIPGKDGRSGYSYQYADLADVAKVAHPLLSKHGLSFTTAPQHLERAGFVLQGTLRHTSGETDTGVLPITGKSAQDLGSSLTYLRRYLLGCMTGIVTDDDEDGGLATEAGTERPQASTPDPVEPAHVAALRERLTGLGTEDTGAIRAWWGDHGVPPLAALTPDLAHAVMKRLDEMEAEASQDPPQPR